MDTQQGAAAVSIDWVAKTGAAARLSGIPVETLRVWERRHAVSGEPLRRGTHRLYSRAQVERLALVKRLVDGGHAIGSLAPLSDAQLAQMMSDASGLRSATPPRHPTTV
ncbi:MAG TPA: MerR family transcriptional regulator, partial [Burkholderiaceae bacterium]|nr:MerR family transcriptional regulator [Burkholderiaceae bacterium]